MALKGWTPSALELLTSAGLRDDGSRPQADVLQQHSSDLQDQAFPELFLGPCCLSQDKTKTILGSKRGPWALSVLQTSTNHLDEQQWISELKQMQWVRPLPAPVWGCLQTQASVTFRWHQQHPVAIKAGSFSHTHISMPPPNANSDSHFLVYLPSLSQLSQISVSRAPSQSSLSQKHGEENRKEVLTQV